MKRKLVGLVLLAAGCEPGGPSSPTSSEVTLKVIDPLHVALSAPLRYALVWRQSGELFTTADGPLEGSEAEVKLVMPDASQIGTLRPVRSAALAVGSAAILTSVVEPQLVAYEDSNNSGAFELRMPAGDGPDRVLAVNRDSVSLGAVLDVEGLLARLPLDKEALFYACSGGRFSPFVALSDLGGAFYFTQWSPSYTLGLDDANYAREALVCGGVTDGDTATTTAVVLDQGIDPTLCGVDAVKCTSMSLSALAAPALQPVTSAAHTRAVQCHRRAPLEAVVVVENSETCDACVCNHEARTTTYVANAANVPAWWPCGTTIAFCDSAQSFVGYLPGCPLQ